MANNHSLRWDTIYDSHLEANLKGKTQAQCFYVTDMATWPQPVQLNHKVPKRGGWHQKKPALSLLALFIPLGLKGSVQYSTGVKYANWDVSTTITSIIGQAVVVTTQANIASIYPETKNLSVPEVKPMLS